MKSRILSPLVTASILVAVASPTDAQSIPDAAVCEVPQPEAGSSESLESLEPPGPRARAIPASIALVDGSLVRGDVLELVPGDHVLVRLPDAEERRIPWSNVVRIEPLRSDAESTGRESDASDTLGTSSEGPTTEADLGIESRLVTLTVEGDEPGLSIRIRNGVRPAGFMTTETTFGGSSSFTLPTSQRLTLGSRPTDGMPHDTWSYGSGNSGPALTTYQVTPLVEPNFTTLCEAPCSVRLFRGERVQLQVGSFRLESRAGMSIGATRVLISDDAIGLRIHVEDHTRRRRNAWIGFATVPVIGVLLSTVARFVPETSRDRDEYTERNQPMFWTGIALMTTPTVSYLWPLLVKHRSRVEVIRAGDAATD